VWEGTRICIEKELPAGLRERIKWEIVLGYLEFGLPNGIARYIGVMQTYIWRRVFLASGWVPDYLGPERLIDGIPTRAGKVLVSSDALDRVRAPDRDAHNPCRRSKIRTLCERKDVNLPPSFLYTELTRQNCVP
jgi:N-acyl-L-homoserine lactone synthetase